MRKGFSFILKTQVRKKMVRMLMMAGLVVGAYVAGYNGVTYVEVMEFVENSMSYIEGMVEYTENFRNEVETVIEETSNYIGMR